MPRWLAEIIRNAALNSPGDQSEIRKGRRARPTPESGEAGQIEKALELFDDAFAAVARNNERLAEAELYRLKGEMLLKVEDGRSRIEDQGWKIEDRGSRIEECFHQAIEIALRQEAKSWELRAAASLARLRLRHGRRPEARRSLSSVYGWFTEGLDTADLKDARALLDELS